MEALIQSASSLKLHPPGRSNAPIMRESVQYAEIAEIAPFTRESRGVQPYTRLYQPTCPPPISAPVKLLI